MNSPHVATRVIAILVAALLAAPGIAAPPERTLPVDPVELVAGREVPGKPELMIERDGFAYQFATPATKTAFEKDPTKYEVADGGACGRMGPLSGLGDARRYVVHEGRIFLFASDACRAGFLKEPAKHIETEDEKIFGSNEQVERGRVLLDKAVAWSWGAERLRSVKTLRTAAERTEKHGDTDYTIINQTALAFPDRAY